MVYPRWFAKQELNPTTEGLSILDLVNSGTVDCRLAGLLWLLMEQRSSVLVAAGPSWAGKTTLMHALLDFLPPDLDLISLRGYYETFKFVNYSQPQRSYLLTEEISDHQYEYLWGVKALRAFSLLEQGYALGGTIHARTAEETIYVLNKWLGLPIEMISQLGAIVMLKARAGPDQNSEPIRRVNSVNLIIPREEGLAIQEIAAQPQTEKGYEYLSEKPLQQVLGDKYSLSNVRVSLEIEAREYYLRHLRKKGKTSRGQVRAAVLEYYK
jgi:hypothetical protein